MAKVCPSQDEFISTIRSWSPKDIQNFPSTLKCLFKYWQFTVKSWQSDAKVIFKSWPNSTFSHMFEFGELREDYTQFCLHLWDTTILQLVTKQGKPESQSLSFGLFFWANFQVMAMSWLSHAYIRILPKSNILSFKDTNLSRPGQKGVLVGYVKYPASN